MSIQMTNLVALPDLEKGSLYRLNKIAFKELKSRLYTVNFLDAINKNEEIIKCYLDDIKSNSNKIIDIKLYNSYTNILTSNSRFISTTIEELQDFFLVPSSWLIIEKQCSSEFLIAYNSNLIKKISIVFVQALITRKSNDTILLWAVHEIAHGLYIGDTKFKEFEEYSNVEKYRKTKKEMEEKFINMIINSTSKTLLRGNEYELFNKVF